MSRANVAGFIVDVKHPLEGGAKILEFQAEGLSSCHGFDLLPDAVKINSAKRVIGERRLRRLAKEDNLCMRDIIELGENTLARRTRQPFIYGGGPDHFLEGRFFDNKAFAALFLDEADRQQILPAQAHFPSVLTAQQATNIASNLGQYLGIDEATDNRLRDNGCVVKLTTLRQGVGVVPLRLEELEDFLRLHFVTEGAAKPSYQGKAKVRAWKESVTSPTFLIQERVRGKPIDAQGNEYNSTGQIYYDRQAQAFVSKPAPVYDPTMRMVFLGWREQGEVRLARIGEYWKLPSQTIPVNKGAVPREAIISDIHEGGSAPVSEQARDNVYAAIAAPIARCLTRLYHEKTVCHVETLVSPGATEAENILGTDIPITVLFEKDPQKLLTILQNIVEIPGRWGKREYTYGILENIGMQISAFPRKMLRDKEVMGFLRDYLATTIHGFVSSSIEQEQHVPEALRILSLYSGEKRGQFRLTEEEVAPYIASIRERFSDFALSTQLAVLDRSEELLGDIRKELRVELMRNTYDALDNAAGEVLLDAILFTFSLPKKTLPMEELEALHRGEGKVHDIVAYAIEKAMALPAHHRKIAFSHLYEINYGTKIDGEQCYPDKVVADFFAAHSAIQRQVQPEAAGASIQVV